ncbi:uncharacterized protein Dwil_GK14235 [Drosophila willistoni]|uniref:Thioredoxin domain-containing protein n=1 Tax=Drosophila willistoni TaxID=7260 RepID=A0A0Q9WVP5_DROWI|nr:sulfhydryl oxidase 1 [Drosophila willistoni]KRG00092.1 uncharacterized protein Dwil_GK14235 [Drosophila willistoni]
MAVSLGQSEPSLYSLDDNVETLDNRTLELALSAPSMGKFVQFINIFCGHCRRFVPTFKRIAIQLHHWRRLLKVYVFDCAQEQNVKVCRDYRIRTTPTMRFFHSNFRRSEHEIGNTTNLRDYQGIIDFLANQVGNNTYEAEGQPTFELITSNDNQQTIWMKNDLLQSNVKYIVLVYQPKGSTIGRDLLLRTIRFEDAVVRITDDQQLFLNFNLDSGLGSIYPEEDIRLWLKEDGEIDSKKVKLVIFTRSGNSMILKPRKDTLDEYVEVTTDFFMVQGAWVHYLSTTQAPNISFTMDQEKQMILSYVLKNKLQIYRSDLEQAIHKLIHIEIPKVSVIEGDSLIALRRLIGWLALSKPLGALGERFFTLLHQKLSQQQQLTGAQFQDQVKELDKQIPKLYKGKRFVGCVSSRPFLRGFTCSLWTLFHYLTVQAAKPPHNTQPIAKLPLLPIIIIIINIISGRRSTSSSSGNLNVTSCMRNACNRCAKYHHAHDHAQT